MGHMGHMGQRENGFPESGSEVDPHAIPPQRSPSLDATHCTVAPFHQVNLPRTSQADVNECLRLRRVEPNRRHRREFQRARAALPDARILPLEPRIVGLDFCPWNQAVITEGQNGP